METMKDKSKKEPKIKDKNISVKESEYKKLQADLAEEKDKYVRLFAEFDNARKRMDREKQEFVKYANEDLIVEFLGILDNLERTVEAASEKHKEEGAFLKGVEMVMAQIHELLKKNGVTRIETKGKKFDPHSHEVLMQEESDEAEGTVIGEFQKGYLLGDKVIRTAKVNVAKPKLNKKI